ncbi:DUF4416 domain-containing protein [candidate division KSB1 bacterium]|nr:MAG: DUF4416 domain-containing protein [candidate division KSB1 bacterium]
MGNINLPVAVKLICAITFAPTIELQTVHQELTWWFGPIDSVSPTYPFTHTDHYCAEMGENLQKQFVSFARLIFPERLVGIKIFINQLEQKFCGPSGGRLVNVDPGYLEKSKLVLATTKNYSHRIYLGAGIFGDVQYRFIRGTFTINDWTYPDYREQLAITFFNKVREIYLRQLKSNEEENGNYL